MYRKQNGVPFVSVVIPTYNSERYITDTLKTVFYQDYDNYEVIVSDDGSSDKTKERVKDFLKDTPNWRLLINNHEGPGAARNKGIKEASGEWITFLDSDDKWFRHKLKTVAYYINQNKGIDLICHSEVWENGRKKRLLNYSNLYNKRCTPFLSLYRRNALSTSAVAVKKELLLKAGLFDTTLSSAQDYDLWLRLSLIPDIKIGFIEEPLGAYITRDGNISSNPEQRLQCLLKIGCKYYKELKKVSRFPDIERLRFEGRAYTAAGLGLIQKRNLGRGLNLFIAGITRWPLRFDWLYKLTKKGFNFPRSI